MWPPVNNGFSRWAQTTATWLDIVQSTVGWGFGDTPAGRRDAYLQLIAPFESPSQAKAMGKMSGCALSCLGWMRCYGLSNPQLWLPYVPGRAVTDVMKICQDHRAWAGPDTSPDVGDIVLVGGPKGFGGTEHVCVVTGFEGSKVQTIDGGQVDVGGQAILRRERELTLHGRTLWLGSRRIAGVGRVGRLSPSKGQWKPSLP